MSLIRNNNSLKNNFDLVRKYDSLLVIFDTNYLVKNFLEFHEFILFFNFKFFRNLFIFVWISNYIFLLQVYFWGEERVGGLELSAAKTHAHISSTSLLSSSSVAAAAPMSTPNPIFKIFPKNPLPNYPLLAIFISSSHSPRKIFWVSQKISEFFIIELFGFRFSRGGWVRSWIGPPIGSVAGGDASESKRAPGAPPVDWSCHGFGSEAAGPVSLRRLCFVWLSDHCSGYWVCYFSGELVFLFFIFYFAFHMFD